MGVVRASAALMRVVGGIGLRRTAIALLAFAGIAGQLCAAEIKVATVVPDGSQWMREMRAGAQRIRELTDGEVELKFYPGGVMGNDAQVLRKIRIGQLHGGAFTASGLSERYQALNLYGIPLLFRSLEEVDYVRERLDPKLAAGLEEAGFISLGFSEGGFANVMANEPIGSVEDLFRRKVWVPEGDPISFMAMESLGLSPVILPLTDVLTGLQTGLLDVVAASPVAALTLQWHTKVSYRTELPVSYSMGIFAVDARTLTALPADGERIVRDVMGEVMQRIDRASREDNREARQVMTEIGVQPVTVNPDDVAGWRRTIQTIYPELRRRSDIDVALLDELLVLLEEYRANNGVAPGRSE
ncbi:TRAP transporter substrate-binding protein DctP [Candidatus Rariloculus sp.]|uniref:TRAP transporter substrate-binding protein n=1 Tax=Candidatus Rariloculus sp. TaxID=3101265 RepID=UPI003D0E8350